MKLKDETIYSIPLMVKMEPAEGGGLRAVSKFKWQIKGCQYGPEFDSKEEALKYIEDNPLDFNHILLT